MGEGLTYLGWRIDFSRPYGEAALVHPGSVQWRVYKNPVAMAIGGDGGAPRPADRIALERRMVPDA